MPSATLLAGLAGLVLGGSAAAGELGPAIGPEAAARLENLVLQDCGSCHGLTRKGGLGSPLTREALAGQEREGIAGIILDGIPQTAMPPWRPLMSEAEAFWIADYLLESVEK